jgi:spore maturation protein CgeB
MVEMGWCPSGRLFEAAACGAPIISDRWPGFDEFFMPGRDVVVAETSEDTLAALALTDIELRRIGESGRERVLADHTCERRAEQLERLLFSASPSRIEEQALGMAEA